MAEAKRIGQSKSYKILGETKLATGETVYGVIEETLNAEGRMIGMMVTVKTGEELDALGVLRNKKEDTEDSYQQQKKKFKKEN